MKKYAILFLILAICNAAYAASINAAAYRTMQQQAYQNRYRQQAQPRQIPYWQAQSNYTTRNRIYNGYSNYYNNSQSNYNQYYYRGR